MPKVKKPSSTSSEKKVVRKPRAAKKSTKKRDVKGVGDVKALLQLAKELEQKEKFDRRNPIYFIKFNKGQAKFFDADVDGELPKRLIYVASNKNGKTLAAVLRGICLAVGEHPFLPEDHPLKYTKDRIPVPNVGLVIGERLTQHIDKKLAPEYLKFIPDICEAEPKKNPQGIITRITLHKDLHGNPLGSVIYFRSFIEEVSTYEGLDNHWISLDEPPPQDLWVAVERGLVAFNGILFMTMTSLKEPWVKDVADTSVDYGGTDRNLRVVEGGTIWENSIENGGFLTQEAIDEFVKIVPPEERRTRLYGDWMSSGTTIYGVFQDKTPWVIPAFNVPKHWTRIEALDPSDARATQWTFGVVSTQDININGEVRQRIFIVDHLAILARSSIEDIEYAVREKRHELGYYNPSVIIIDAKHGRREAVAMDSIQPTTWQDKLEEVGIGYVDLSRSNPGDVELGHKMVRQYLHPQFSTMEGGEVPGVVLFDNCGGESSLIEGMKRYRYKPNSIKPEEKYKDVVDPIRYLVAYGPSYIERSEARAIDYMPRNRFTGR